MVSPALVLYIIILAAFQQRQLLPQDALSIFKQVGVLSKALLWEKIEGPML